MNITQAVAARIRQLCEQRAITPNALSYIAAVPQSTVKSILNGESANPGIATIKKLCDGLDITMHEFFDSPLFAELEQEIR
jgi:transcriptional regulator with XRE-family HTH domain